MREGLPQADSWLAAMPLQRGTAVAWSGGADSTALLLALHTLDLAPFALHIDHGWHADSAAQAAGLREQAAAWGIPFACLRLHSVPRANREAAARAQRYAALLKLARMHAIDTLCLAHQADDQAETVCLRLLAGAGPVGIGGMRRERMWRGLTLMRPLLHVRASALRAALRQAGVSWLEDESNRDLSLKRNWVRHRLFPRMRAAGVDPVALFLRLGAQARRVAEQLQTSALDLRVEEEVVSVDWRQWQASSPARRAFQLQRMITALLGEGASLGRRHIELAERWLAQGGRGGIDLTRSRLSREAGRLHLRVAKAKLWQ